MIKCILLPQRIREAEVAQRELTKYLKQEKFQLYISLQKAEIRGVKDITPGASGKLIGSGLVYTVGPDACKNPWPFSHTWLAAPPVGLYIYFPLEPAGLVFITVTSDRSHKIFRAQCT